MQSCNVVWQCLKHKSCIFTVEFIREFSHFPFNLQPHVNKILDFLVLQLKINLSCFDWLLVALPLQNQSERVFSFVFNYCSNELSLIAQ